MKKIVIAIDGYSACGKSTTAKAVAEKLGFAYIDTGAMYRAVTLYFIQNYINPSNPREVTNAINNIDVSFHYNNASEKNETYLNGLNVEEEIRKMYVSEKVSVVSAIKDVRIAMVNQQRKLGGKKGVVMDGRDIGTNVFPNAELKIFMVASMEARAGRRQAELLGKEQLVDLSTIEDNLRQRDEMDSSRKENPLVQAEDAYVLDTSYLTIEEQVDIVLNLATEKIIAENAK
jgi:cytidylate kinase